MRPSGNLITTAAQPPFGRPDEPRAGYVRHVAALRAAPRTSEPPTCERGYVWLLAGLLEYADGARRTWDVTVGDDQYIAPNLLDIVHALRQLLSADIGRLDGGTVDQLLRDFTALNGLQEEP